MIPNWWSPPRFALRRPVTVVMALCGIVVLGVLAYQRMPLELMPSGRTSATIRVDAGYRGATPADLLEQILEPAEESLRTLSGLSSLRTTADFERGSIRLRFHPGTDMNAAYLRVREKLERVRPQLPGDFRQFSIRRYSQENWPILWARVAVPTENTEGVPDLLVAMEAALLRLPGVARVDSFGWAEREVAVLVDPDALRRLNVDPLSVANTLRRDNFVLPVGELRSSTLRIPVRTLARLENLEALEALPLAGRGGAFSPESAEGRGDQPRPPGAGLRVGEVGRVIFRDKAARFSSMVDGRPAVLLAVYKEDTANTVAVGKALRRAFEEVFPTDPQLARLEVRTLFAEDSIITDSLRNLQWTALWGGAFATAILLLFLRRFRPTLLVVTAIPLSLLITLIVMYLLGFSINVVSITGMMLALGMLVDNAVVVVENASRLRAQGLPAGEAAARGAGEVGLAVLMGTLTTVIVFLPLPFLQSRAFLAFLFRHLSWPITLALGASLLVAVFFVPPVARYLLQAGSLAPAPWFLALQRGYGRVLARALRRPLDSALVLGLILLTVWLPISGLKWDLFGSRSQKRVRIEFQHDPVFGLEGTREYFEAATTRLLANRDQLGLETVLASYHALGGRLSLFMADNEEQGLTRRERMRQVSRILGSTAGVTFRLGRSGQEDDTPTLSLRISGPSPRVLEEQARGIIRDLEGTPGLETFSFEDTRAPDRLEVRLRREAAEHHGITARETAQRVGAALRGLSDLPGVLINDREVEVVLQQDQAAHAEGGMSLLENLRLGKRGGGEVPLSAVADLLVREAPTRIVREDGETSVTLEARTTGDDFAAIEEAVRTRLESIAFPPGYRWALGEEVRRLREDRRSMVLTLVLALLAVFLVMGVLFESFLLPLSVLATVPLAFFGSLWLLYLTGTALDTTGMIGVVILAGVVVNNGIVLVDRINRNQKEGLALLPAIEGAAAARLRPILMTALTTIFGLLPMALGYTNVAGYSFAALGQVVAGGLLASTLLTLFAVPLAYLALMKISGADPGNIIVGGAAHTPVHTLFHPNNAGKAR